MACPICTKSDNRLKQLKDCEGWECSHVDCPNRRNSWSEQVRVSSARPKPMHNPIKALLDKVRD